MEFLDITRIDGFVSPRAQPHFVLSLLQLQLQRFTLVLPLLPHLLSGSQRHLHGVSADRGQNLIGNGLINSETTERNAPLGPMVDMRALTVITQRSALDARIGDMQHTAATAASQNPGQ